MKQWILEEKKARLNLRVRLLKRKIKLKDLCARLNEQGMVINIRQLYSALEGGQHEPPGLFDKIKELLKTRTF